MRPPDTGDGVVGEEDEGLVDGFVEPDLLDKGRVLHRAEPWDWSEPRVMVHTRVAGDPTTEATVPEGLETIADVVLREPGIVCGLGVALDVVRRLDPDAELEVLVPEGTSVRGAPCTVARLRASVLQFPGSLRRARRTAAGSRRKPRR